MIFTFSNLLSLIRGPAALLFLSQNLYLRTLAIVIAIITDFLDGYLARRFNSISKLGRILDPCMDKIFVIFVLTVFYLEGKIEIWQAVTFLSRDFALIAHTLFLMISGRISKIEIKQIWYGKLFTTLQFILLLALTYGFIIPTYIYMVFVVLGLLTFKEIYPS